MKIVQAWGTATPSTSNTVLDDEVFGVSNLNQTPDALVLSDRVIFDGTSASFTITTKSKPQDLVIFDLLANKLEVYVTYTDTNSIEQTTDTIEVRNQTTTDVNEWSTDFRTQSTNEWEDFDHLNTFSDAATDTDYVVTFDIETIEDEDNDIKGEIDTWNVGSGTKNGSFNADAGNIPLGSRIKFSGITALQQISVVFGSGMADDTVTLSGTAPTSETTIERIYRPISLSKALVSTNTLEVNNPHWGMSRSRNVIQASHNMHRGRLIPLNRPGINYDSYTLTTGFKDLMSQDFIDFLQAQGTGARPFQIISENVDNSDYVGREWIILGQFQGLPTETLDARNHRQWSMNIIGGII